MAIYTIKKIKDSELKTCCICGKKFEGFGNNPYPVKSDGICCDKCNYEKVIPARIKGLISNKVSQKDSQDDILENLIKSEEKAIEEYSNAILLTEDLEKIKLYKHILMEEKEHLTELKKL